MTDSVYEMARENPSTKSIFSNKGSVVSKNSSLLICSICLSKLLDPALLTCGHKFCEECLQKYWISRDRPVFIVCPLCRANIFDVDFSQDSSLTTNEFRKNFRNYLDSIAEADDSACPSLTCLKISIVLPALYYLWKWLGVPIIELLMGDYKF